MEGVGTVSLGTKAEAFGKLTPLLNYQVGFTTRSEIKMSPENSNVAYKFEPALTVAIDFDVKMIAAQAVAAVGVLAITQPETLAIPVTGIGMATQGLGLLPSPP